MKNIEKYNARILGRSILENIVSWLKEKWYTVYVFTDVYENKSIPFFSEWLDIMQIIDENNNKFIIDTNWNTKIYGPEWNVVYNNWSEYNEWLPFDIEKATNKDYLELEEKWYTIDESSWYSIFNIDNEMEDESICLNNNYKDIIETIDSFIKLNK